MAEQQDAATQTPQEVKCVFSPVKENPAEAEEFVRGIFKHKPNDVDLVAAELAPLYGLSSQDPLAQSRAQAVFTSPQITEPLQEFLQYFVKDLWGLPLPNWAGTIDLVHKHRNDERWTRTWHPLVSNVGTPEQYYARFIIRMLDELLDPFSRDTHMLQWLHNGEPDDVCWVLFHALMCFQLKRMELNKQHAPKKVVAAYYFHKFFNDVSKFISARKGAGELNRDLF
ncbi:hypothetical protein F4782DRAFT_540057 [Xylaria castorea]|nr:hypothetical protein F4782DRAFT_540057 [Xylaria castorea]